MWAGRGLAPAPAWGGSEVFDGRYHPWVEES